MNVDVRDPSRSHFISFDPGTKLGVAVYSFDPELMDLRCEDVRTVDVGRNLAGLERIQELYGDRVARHIGIISIVRSLIEAWDPIFVVSEAAHFKRIVVAFESLVECIQTIRTTVITQGNGCPFFTVTASEVKAAVGAKAFSGDKDLVAKGVKALGLVPSIKGLDEHSTDALAVGYAQYCYLYGLGAYHERIDDCFHDRGRGRKKRTPRNQSSRPVQRTRRRRKTTRPRVRNRSRAGKSH